MVLISEELDGELSDVSDDNCSTKLATAFFCTALEMNGSRTRAVTAAILVSS